MTLPSLLNYTVGEYRLVELLGAGGMGEVYRGVHTKIGRVVAVKVLSQANLGPEFLERFLNEARIQSGLQHPNIATLYDFLEFNNQPCIIMELVEGQTISDLIQARGAIPAREAVALFNPILSAIGYIHSQGITHRDIKSSNVKISPSGQVKLLDFGIAKSNSSPSLTQAGGFIGTLQYLSPEQLKGGYADARSDIWALGILLYETVTGYMPFEANTIGELYEKVNRVEYTKPTALNQSVPSRIESVIARCLKKNASERYQSAQQMLDDLARVDDYSGGPGPGARLDPLTGKKRWLIIAGGATFLLFLGVGAYSLMGGGEPSPPANRSAQPPGNQLAGPAPARSAAQPKSLTIDVAEGRAEVYRDGQKLGTTPFNFEARQGEQINFILKNDGFIDKPVEISITDNRKVYTFNMAKR
ncbi:MAG TPA: serine/threonine-protein kinase [Blastocatellia bacterium]|nr:serine/threonine-protein kinase [Blastocatellia bacterium]